MAEQRPSDPEDKTREIELAVMRRAIFAAADDSHNTWPTPEHPECARMAEAAHTALMRLRAGEDLGA